MESRKASLKQTLLRLHLYAPVHFLWVHRPDLRTMVWNLGYRLAGSGDHYPIPPEKLIYLTINSREISWYLHSSQISFACLRNALEMNGYSPERFDRVLDFGCGCGRVLRFWSQYKTVKKYGSDYNPELIKWDQAHLKALAKFDVNGLAPPLTYPNDFFDFIYALSVFTHFPERLQTDWMSELCRVLKPCGLLLITLHGKSRLSDLNCEQRTRFLDGKMVVVCENSAGENLCGAYHPFEYVRNSLVPKLELLDYIEAGARDSNQDIYLFLKATS